MGPTSSAVSMKGEHIKEWLDLAYPQQKPGEQDIPPAQPEQWDKLVKLVQYIFETGDIPEELHWSFLATIPKPDGGTRGVGLIEPYGNSLRKLPTPTLRPPSPSTTSSTASKSDAAPAHAPFN